MNKEQDILTISAKSALKDVLSECEERILDEAYSIAAQRSYDDEIEIVRSDIILAKHNLFSDKKSKVDKTSERRKHILFTIVFVSVIYLFVGVFLILKDHFSLDITKDLGSMITLLSAVTGLTSVFLYQTFDYRKRILKERKKEIEKLDRELMHNWSQIEHLGKMLLSHYERLMDNPGLRTQELYAKLDGVRTYVDLINKILEPELQEQFKWSLRVRNMIAHGESDDLQNHSVERAIDIAATIVHELRVVLLCEVPGLDEEKIDLSYNQFRGKHEH